MPSVELMIPTLGLFALALVARRAFGSWFAPGAYFALFWSFEVALSYVAPEFTPWSGALWWILLSCTMVVLGCVVGVKVARAMLEDGQPGVPRRLTFRLAAVVIVSCTVIALAYTVLSLFIGVDISVPGERPPVLFQLLLPFHFAGPILAGAILSSGSLSKRWRPLTLLPLLPPAILSLIWTGRTAIVAPIMSWLAGYIAVQIMLRRGRLKLFTVRYLTAGLMVFVIFLTIIIVVDTFRIVRGDTSGVKEQVGAYASVLSFDEIGSRWDRSRAGLLGNVYSFSYYFVDAWAFPPAPHGGTITFAAPLDFFGLGGERYPYEEFELAENIYSNIFTTFRSPIDDFGLAGSLLWWFLIGLAQGFAFAAAARGRVLAIVLLAWFYVDVSLIGGFFFRYNSIIVSYAIAFAAMWLLARVGPDSAVAAAGAWPELVAARSPQ